MRKSQVLRSPVHIRDFRDLGFAKFMCETFYFARTFAKSLEGIKLLYVTPQKNLIT